MASGPIISLQIEREKVEAMTDFIFLGSKITADSDGSPEIKKQRHHFADKGLAEAEAPILWPPDTKSQLIGKDPDAGKDWRQTENRVAEDEMVR